MTNAAAVQAFIYKWEQNTQKESAAAKEHFAELCRIIGVPTPNDPGSGPNTYCFEKSLTKTGGKAGFADVWKKDCFAWEYKGKKRSATLETAYAQLLLYKEDLGNPPILVVCDIATYEVHIAFTGYRTRVEKFANTDLANASTRELLRLVFTDPEQLRPVERQETITKKAAEQLAKVARFLEDRKFAPSEVAHFFMKVLFALFAEDIHLLPAELMSQSIKQAIFKPEEFVGRARALFRAMKTGDYFGIEKVPRFNGWLFDDDEVLPLNASELQYLSEAAKLDWSQVEPAIFGTLFERSLDPTKRAQLGLHYTSRDDILLIVEPVLMAPLRREWEDVKTGVEALRDQWEPLAGNARRKLMSVAEGMLLDFMERLAKVRVLDPSCGSGNFLYVALNQLKNLEKEVWTYAGGIGLTQPELGVSPAQVFGIEKNQFAAELAQVVVWIGYLQWQRANGFFDVQEPILQNLHNIECRDAIFTVDLHGNPVEPEWPEVDVIVGNPPFLGGKWMQRELGEAYKTALWQVYDGRVPRTADLVMYWFEKARAAIEGKHAKRAGLLTTNTVRQGNSTAVLRRIKETGNIFLAYTDHPWLLEGAALRVSLIGFDDGTEQEHKLNNQVVAEITSDLTAGLSINAVQPLIENHNICFRSGEKNGPFDIPEAIALAMLQSQNADGKLNAEILFPYVNAMDMLQSSRKMWLIDFGEMSLVEAQLYEEPFAYILKHVKPVRDANNRKRRREYWWQHGEIMPRMRRAVQPLKRFIVTPLISKHRVFIWLDSSVKPDVRLVVFARDDDYFFGVLQSRLHEIWALRLGAQHGGERPTYNVTSCFDTYPFPWPPGKEPQNDPRVQAIAEAARELVSLRDEWLNPSVEALLKGDAKLKDRTLTNLYNKRPDWLDQAHKRLDAAVFDAYGWPHDLSDDEILARLLALNLARAAGQGVVPVAVAEDEGDDE